MGICITTAPIVERYSKMILYNLINTSVVISLDHTDIFYQGTYNVRCECIMLAENNE